MIENACRDRQVTHHADASPNAVPGESWVRYRIALELEPIGGGKWRLLVEDVDRDYEGRVRKALREADRGRVGGEAVWDAHAASWKVEERELPDSFREVVPKGWAKVVLDQALVNPDFLATPSGASHRHVDRWRAFDGEMLALNVDGRLVPCAGEDAGFDLCWEGSVEVVRQGSGTPSIGGGTISLRGRLLEEGLGAGPKMYALVTRTIRAEIQLADRRVEWTQECRTTLRPRPTRSAD